MPQQGRSQLLVGKSRIDVVLDAADPEPQQSFEKVVQQLHLKGFCVASLRLAREEVYPTAAREAAFLSGQVGTAPHPFIAEGLLGSGGLMRICVERSFEALQGLSAVHSALSTYGFRRLLPYYDNLKSQMPAILHCQTGWTPPFTGPELEMREAASWLETFKRHMIMSIIFLGPAGGRLDLKPWNTEDAGTYSIKTTEGTMVILYPDVLSRTWRAAKANSYAMSIFGLRVKGNPRRESMLPGWQAPPPMQDISEWKLRHLMQLKESMDKKASDQADDGIAELPRSWRKLLSQNRLLFCNEQIVTVRSVAYRLPSGIEDGFRGWPAVSSLGTDLSLEVPQLRWDHAEVCGSDADGEKDIAMCCKHGTFVDGIELFDSTRFSRWGSDEIEDMGPYWKLIMEVGSTALSNTGLRGKTLKGTSFYMACGENEWTHRRNSGSAADAARFARDLDLHGRSLAVGTAGASGMTALYLAVDSLEEPGTSAVTRSAQDTAQSIAIGLHLCISPAIWRAETSKSWLSLTGRCSTFDASAAGFIRGEGCCAAVVKRSSPQEPGISYDEEESAGYPPDAKDIPLMGAIAGIRINNSGRDASITAPNTVAEQDVMRRTIRSAMVWPEAIECVEAHGSGILLSDAIEVISHRKAHRDLPDTAEVEPLHLIALKTSMGDQNECAGLAGFIRTLHIAKCGLIVPNLHLAELNPNVDPDLPLLTISSEKHEFTETEPLVGTFSRGVGGTNVYVLAQGQLAAECVPEPGYRTSDSLVFWPGGGYSASPQKDFFISGTWTPGESTKMEHEGHGIWGYTMTLGENRWERFKIRLDDLPGNTLHPDRRRAPKNTAALGPDANADDFGWCVDGRTKPKQEQRELPTEVADACGDESALVETADTGHPGERYRIKLQINRHWRFVSWEKMPSAEGALGSVPTASTARYYIIGQWNGWQLREEMVRDAALPGLFRADVRPSRRDAEFQIERDGDPSQVLYPERPHADSDCRILGPDDDCYDLNWQLAGSLPGETWRVTFERRRGEDGSDVRRISWQRTTEESPGNDRFCEEEVQRYFIVGTWDNFELPRLMDWTGEYYRYTIKLGNLGQESFEIRKDGQESKAFFPNIRRATCSKFHVLKGPGINVHNLYWTINSQSNDLAEAGTMYEVRLLTGEDRRKPKRVEWVKVTTNSQPAFELENEPAGS